MQEKYVKMIYWKKLFFSLFFKVERGKFPQSFYFSLSNNLFHEFHFFFFSFKYFFRLLESFKDANDKREKCQK